MKRSLAFLLGVTLLMLSAVSFAQNFGKNHVQYNTFNMSLIQSEHFDIYFAQGGLSVAEFVAAAGEQSYRELREDFRYELTDRVSIIVYNSHNDFQQTNVQYAPPEESVGGFTEFFKNRVVIPYEGDWEKFRHVIHHELTHAVTLQMLFGSGVQSIITGLARLQLPLWFIEGLAEYESRGWDTQSDMFMRDAALNGYATDIDYFGGFLAYKGGQSLFYYLSQKYGGEKIGELLGKVKLSKSVERGFRQSIGVGIEDLNKRFQKHLKKEYWPDIAGRQEPEDFAKRLTDHTKDRNFINNRPTLSPQGDKIAFLSDKSDYFDIYLMSAIDGKIITKLVSGQKSGNLEELQWLRPGITWSPDAKYIAFTSRSGGENALNLLEVKSKKITRELKFGLDGLFSPTWSPTNNEVAFIGTKQGQCDIYAVDLKTETIRKVTDDIFSEGEPAFSPDGKKIAFTSDRGAYGEATDLPEGFQIWRHNYRNTDIYTVDAVGVGNGGRVERLTDTPYLEESPIYSPAGDKLAFTSDRCGIFNIYVHDLATHAEYPITNVIGSVFHLSWAGDGSKMAFTSFYNAGYDIYLMKNPLDVKPDQIKLEKTAFLKRLEENRQEEPATIAASSETTAVKEEKKDSKEEKYRNYVFGQEFAEGALQTKEQKSAFLDSTQYKLASGEYKVKKYKTKFSPDIIYGNAGYSQFFGVQGQTLLSFSDVMGDQRIDIYTDLFYDLRNSNFLVQYYYLPKRIDWGVGPFHYAYYFYSNRYLTTRDRYFGLNLYASRPFSTFRRLAFSSTLLGINRDFLELIGTPPGVQTKIRVAMGTLSLVHDTAVWGYTGPTNGSRSEFSVTYSPNIAGSQGLDFLTFRADWRKYYKIGKEYNFVVRVAGGASNGHNPQQFFLGGLDNWLNQHYKGGIRIDRPEDIYFSSFETPLRGTDYYELAGSRFGLMNVEFRFPMVRYLILGWPLPLGLANIRGAIFSDVGSAWSETKKFKPFRSSPGGGAMLDDLVMGYGVGARANLGFLLLRFDVAWKTDWANTQRPKYYLSLGTEF